MKYLYVLLSFTSIPVLLLGAPAKVELGHSLDQVTEILGEAIGTLVLGNKTILMYPQGDVTLRDNKVLAIDLMSDSEFAAEQERKRLEREEWRIRQEKLSAARLKEGRQVKAAKLKSRAFAALPSKQQVDYWRSFQIRYPEVDVTEQITGALEVYQAELAAQATEKRIAALEARVAQSEQAADKAQRENERLRNQLSSRNYFYNSGYSYRTTPYPVCYPQRKVIIRSGKTHLKRCSDSSKQNNRRYVHRESESTSERATRILSSVR